MLPTPFRHDGEIDPDAFRRLVRFAMDAGTSGVVFPGFASEVEALGTAERTRCLGIAAEETAGRVVLVAGATADTAEEVIRHCALSETIGVRWVMIQPPRHLGTQSGPVIRFLRTISEAHPDLCIILQNAPAPRGSDLEPGTLLEIANAIARVAYIKEETIPAGPPISRLLSDPGRPDHLRGMIGGGGARYVLDEYARGACAAMPAAELADLHVALDSAWRNGRHEEAREIYVRTLPLLTLQAAYRMRLTKHVLVRRGILENAVVRVPLPALDRHAIADIDANLEWLGLVRGQGLARERAA